MRLRAELALLCALVPGVAAWDKDGHEAIGMTTMSALEGPAVAQVKHLMGGRDAVDVASWAHKVNKKFPWTTVLHFQPQPNPHSGDPAQTCKKADMSVCKDNKCLIKAMKHFYGRLTGQDLVTIEWPKEMKLTDADCIKYLINLIGDLHQPMHLSWASDDMGRNVTVEFRGKKMSYYDFWDRELIAAVMADSPGFWWGGWTHVERTRVEYEADGERFKKEGVASFDHWADETVKFFCENARDDPKTGKPLDKESGVIKIDVHMFEMWKRQLLSRLLVAGARTAIVLNAVLSHRAGKPELHAGSSVKGLEGEEDSEKQQELKGHLGRKGDLAHHGNAYEGPQAALYNFLTFAVVSVIFLQVMKTWQGRDAINQADREKARSGGKKI